MAVIRWIHRHLFNLESGNEAPIGGGKNFLLAQDGGGFILMEDGSKIILEMSI